MVALLSVQELTRETPALPSDVVCVHVPEKASPTVPTLSRDTMQPAGRGSSPLRFACLSWGQLLLLQISFTLFFLLIGAAWLLERDAVATEVYMQNNPEHCYASARGSAQLLVHLLVNGFGSFFVSSCWQARTASSVLLLQSPRLDSNASAVLTISLCPSTEFTRMYQGASTVYQSHKTAVVLKQVFLERR